MPWGEGINSHKSIMQQEQWTFLMHEQDLPARGLCISHGACAGFGPGRVDFLLRLVRGCLLDLC